jgi:tetratricopeptide (TPR) repeat protein
MTEQDESTNAEPLTGPTHAPAPVETPEPLPAGAAETGAQRWRRGWADRKVARFALVVLLLAVIGVAGWAVSPFVLAEYHLREAEKALRRQRYPAALESYERALRHLPNRPDLHLHAGRTARRAGQIPAAREHLRRCRELQGAVSEELQLELYLLRAQTGEVDEVHRYLLPYLLKEGPLTPLVLEALVRAHMGLYRMELAWKFLHRWLELEPDNVEALFRRGTWYAQQQNIEGAARDFRRVLELDPERNEVRLVLAEILRADKKFAEVAEQYEQVLARSPQDAAALTGLAQCRLETGRVAEARQLLEAIPAAKLEAADVYWLRGIVAMREGRPGDAEPLLRSALALEPRHFDACYNLMLCLNRLKRPEEAAQMRDRVNRIEQDQKRLIAITTREMTAAPQNPVLHCELGEIYLRLGMPERALHWLYAGLKIDPNYRRAHEILRDYYDGLGAEGREGAEAHRRQLAELDRKS